MIAVLLLPAGAYAQSPAGEPTTAASQEQNAPAPQDGPAVAKGEATKPTRGLPSALLHNLFDDLKHMPRRNTLYWLAAGSVLALAVHPADNDINAHLVNDSTDALWKPGHIVGSTQVVLGGAAATYVFGRLTDHPRVQHLGMDEIESALLAEGFTQALKIAVRRQRPLQVNGDQSRTYSFPSGHATITFAAATVLQQHLGYRAAIPTYLIASYVAMSRLHDNRHFASDVVFGSAMGIIIGRSVTWHGRNFYASPMLLPGGTGVQVMVRR
jgi:membrane-associated phospholipid phosphatase